MRFIHFTSMLFHWAQKIEKKSHFKLHIKMNQSVRLQKQLNNEHI